MYPQVQTLATGSYGMYVTIDFLLVLLLLLLPLPPLLHYRLLRLLLLSLLEFHPMWKQQPTPAPPQYLRPLMHPHPLSCSSPTGSWLLPGISPTCWRKLPLQDSFILLSMSREHSIFSWIQLSGGWEGLRGKRICVSTKDYHQYCPIELLRMKCASTDGIFSY